MTKAEWESLCDGCALCCLNKLEDEQTGEIAYTDVCCHLLDSTSCRCTRYAARTKLVPQCVELSPRQLAKLNWMPPTCAYRLIHEGKPLPDWHPLVSGDPSSVHRAGVSVRGWCVSEIHVDESELEDRIIAWPEDS